MRQPVVCLLCVGLFGLLSNRVDADTLGDEIANQGGSQMLVNAGNAIQGTCRVLSAAGGANQTGPNATQQQDLFYRCNEMVTTYGLGSGQNPFANSYGYVPGSSGDPNRANAVQQFSGEEASSQQQLETQTNTLQFTAIGARMDAIRHGIRPTGSGVAMNVNGTDVKAAPVTGVFGPLGGAAGDAADADVGWAWFVNANVGAQNHDRSPSSDRYDADYYGGTFGADYAMANGAVFGVAFGYENYSIDIDSSGSLSSASPTSPSAGGGIDGDSYTVSAYGTYTYDEYYMSAIVSYGTADYDLDRRALFLPGVAPVGRPAAPGFIIDRSYSASTDSDQLAAEATLGAIAGSQGAFSLDGYVKLDYLSMYIDGYTEKEVDHSATPTTTPGLAFTYLGQNVSTLQAGMGATLRWDIGTSFGVVVPYVGEEVRYRWNGGSGNLKYSYAYALQHVNFSSPVDSDDRIYSVVTAGISAQLAHNIAAFAQYEGFVGLNNVTGGVGTIGVRGTF